MSTPLEEKSSINEQLQFEHEQYYKLQKVKIKRPEKTRIIAVTNNKGGVGKTTTVVNIAGSLAKKNQKVLVIDIDQQANASTALNATEDESTHTIFELLTAENPNINNIIKNVSENLDVIPSSTKLSNLELTLRDELLLTKKLKNVRELKKYDYIFIDCPPSMGLFTLNALCFAKEVLITVQSEYYALEGLAQLLNNISDIKKNFNEELTVTGIIMTMFSVRNNLSNEVVEEVKKHFPLLIFDTVIPRSVKIAEAPSFSQTIIDYAPKSIGAISYIKTAIELSEKNI